MSITLDGSLGITSPSETVPNTFSSSSNFGFKNKIINGACVIDQRNAGASGTASNVYTVDRFQYAASQASKGTWGQNLNSVTLPVGFTNYLGFQSSSAYTVGVAEVFRLQQSIEGLNVSDLGWGTANASAVTLSFKVYSSLTGTFGGAISNSASSRSYPFSYSIPVANTWANISITIAGDTTGTWLTTNGIGAFIKWSLGAGATPSGTAGTWASADYTSATGAVSVVGTSGATFYITGVQLEKGSTATSFDYRPYGTELALCQRYYWQNTLFASGCFGGGVGNVPIVTTLYPVSMRAAPTFAWISGGIASDGINDFTITSNYGATTATSGAYVLFNQSGSGASGRGCVVRNATCSFSAEL